MSGQRFGRLVPLSRVVLVVVVGLLGWILSPGVVSATTATPAAGTDADGSCSLFVPAEVAANDRFGSSIGIDGNDLAVGSWLADEQGLRDAGSVTVFALADDGTPTEVQRLVAGNPQAAANFGFSVDLDGDVLAVGAVAETVDADGIVLSEAGAVYVYERVTADQPWTPVARLVAADAGAEDSFGYSLEVDAASGTILIGAHTDDVETDAGVIADAGSAYLFERDPTGGWIQQAKLVDPAARPGDRAAHDVAVSGPWMVVGHHLDDQIGNRTVNNAGGGLLFERTDGGVTGPLELTGSAAAARDRAGIGVDVDNDLLVMTSWSQQPGDRSALWVFRYDGVEWREEVRIEVDDPTSALAASEDADTASDNATDDSAADDRDAADDGGVADDEGVAANGDAAEAVGAGSQFGRHVELAGGVIAVGAAGDDLQAVGGGAVHYFGMDAGAWVRLARVAPDGVGENAQAGIAVGLSDRWAAMGAERAELGVRNSGGACVLPVAGLLAPAVAGANQNPGVEVFVDAGERAPAPAVPLAAGPLQRFTGNGSNNTVLLLVGAAAAIVAVAAGVLMVRARGRLDRRRS